MNKKGTVRDIVFLGSAGFLLFLFSIVVVHLIISTLLTNIAANDMIAANSDAIEVINRGQQIYNRLDIISVSFLIAVTLGVVISSWVFAASPIFIIGYIVAGIIAIISSVFASNFWEDLTAVSQFTTTMAVFPIANLLMLNLPTYIAILWFLGFVISFAKPKEDI